MKQKTVLITGGAGFVGSHLALRYKEATPEARVIALDNLKRRGSELNVTRLMQGGVEFQHGDIRNLEDVMAVGPIGLIVECSAEPSVLAGYDGSPEYLIRTNLTGTIHCLELARRHGADMIFLSTSRVYPTPLIEGLAYEETPTRFQLHPIQSTRGVSARGFNEELSMEGPRSLYGTTKLCSELLLQEYIAMYKIRGVINRCGVITGPWQMGKVDQGFVVLWVANHIFNRPLSYIGYGGSGKQVRDILHIEDLFRLFMMQLKDLNQHNGHLYNVGGGVSCSVSLRELTQLCQKATGNQVPIKPLPENRPADIRLYLSDTTRVQKSTGWKPEKSCEAIVEDITRWVTDHRSQLQSILGSA